MEYSKEEYMSNTRKLRVFVSSVQKELQNERISIAELVSLDPFLNQHIQPILFEELPASAVSAEQAYLQALHSCQVYLGILGFEYGRKGSDGFSATHREYKEACIQGIPTFFFIKGENHQDSNRDDDLLAFFSEIRDEAHGHVYKRFTHYRSLKTHARDVLLSELEKQGISPTIEEEQIAEHTIAAASEFDAHLIARAGIQELDMNLCHQYVSSCTKIPEKELDENSIYRALLNRGILWQDDDSDLIHPTTAGLLLLGHDPEVFIPQSRIAANAFGGAERGEPIDRADIRDALPIAIERANQFLKRNMRHITRIEGFKKYEIHEYPYEALREAVVNAVAHRDYELTGSCIRIEKYVDRIEIISPGLPPAPITLQKIEQLDYIACSRNPNLARGLSFFERIEEQGDGLRRIVSETVALGLPRPQFQFYDGHFKVIFFAPEDMHELRSQSKKPIIEVPDHVLLELSNTQRLILQKLMQEQEVKVPDLADELDLSEQAIRKAMKLLIEKGLVIQKGKARSTTYVFMENTL